MIRRSRPPPRPGCAGNGRRRHPLRSLKKRWRATSALNGLRSLLHLRSSTSLTAPPSASRPTASATSPSDCSKHEGSGSGRLRRHVGGELCTSFGDPASRCGSDGRSGGRSDASSRLGQAAHKLKRLQFSGDVSDSVFFIWISLFSESFRFLHTDGQFSKSPKQSAGRSL